MPTKTKIEWTDLTWNPVRGCNEVSPGCDHCYAKKQAERFRECPGNPYEAGFELRLAPHKLIEPLKLTKPRLIFVNSMSDLFHQDVPDDYIGDVLRVMYTTPWHTYQILTKRHHRMAKLLTNELAWAAKLPNVWWGVSVEDKKYGLPRIDALRRVPTRNRFISIEPLLEDLGQINLSGIDWVIVGGESGPLARPMHGAWVRSIRDQCLNAGVKFFFKQWGTANKKKAGRILDDQTWDDKPMQVILPVGNQAERRAMIKTIQDKYGLIDGSPLLIDPTS